VKIFGALPLCGIGIVEPYSTRTKIYNSANLIRTIRIAQLFNAEINPDKEIEKRVVQKYKRYSQY